MSTRTIHMEILRYHPERGEAPRFESFEVPVHHDSSLLDGLRYVKDRIDGSLSFRWSCRMAVCGSCGVMVDGEPKLGCQVFLRDYGARVRVEPLAHFPIERDLAIDQHDFLDKLQGAGTWLVPAQTLDPAEGPRRQTPAELERFSQFSHCINCLLCYAACPQYGLDPDFTGPAVLSLVHRYNEDSRDAGKAARMELLDAEEGVWGCTLVGHCSEVCPKAVDPALAINRNKIESAKDYFLRFLTPRGRP
ncbi:MAG: succinate dehydrogenase/fumarate reductase iron-sulfur subunit [Pseudomonadales bacterium]|jgi:fumarate reductase iron-sulfur subunit|nr:succinate dehydrogenase/fumarate reductase iron-sulfur subunit [Pseudomonadales bacterium]